MRSWNTHAWYITGILAALLIGSISVQWSGIKDLAGIVSFALGLSSLLLALIAIIQTITSGGNIEGALSNVRGAAEDLQQTSASLVSTAADLKSLSNQVLEKSDENKIALVEIKDQLKAKSTQDQSTSTSSPPNPGYDFNLLAKDITYGGAVTAYTLALALKSEKPFRFVDIYKDVKGAPAMSYMTAYAAAIATLTPSKITFKGLEFSVESLMGQEDRILRETRSRVFIKTPKKELDRILKAADDYFAPPTSETEEVTDD